MDLIGRVNFIWPIGWTQFTSTINGKSFTNKKAIFARIHNLKRVTEITLEDSDGVNRYVASVRQIGLPNIRHILFDNSILGILLKIRDAHLSFTDSYETAIPPIKLVQIDMLSISRVGDKNGNHSKRS